MRLPTFLRLALPSRLDLGRNQEGVAAVEFALVLPFMLLLYLCTAALTQGVEANRDVSVLARTLTDLVSQQSTTLTDTTAQDIFNSSTAVMSPFPTTSLKMTLSNIEFVYDPLALTSNMLDAKTRWTVTFSGGALRPCETGPLLTPVSNTATPSATTMPLGLYAAGFLIVADVSYTYTPSFGFFTFSNGNVGSTAISMTMSRTSYMRPRQTSNIHYQSGQTAHICPILPPQTS